MQNIGGQLEYFDISGSVMSSITDDGMRSVVTYCKQLDTLGISLVKGITGISLLPMLENQKRALLLRRLMLSLRNVGHKSYNFPYDYWIWKFYDICMHNSMHNFYNFIAVKPFCKGYSDKRTPSNKGTLSQRSILSF